MKKSVLVLLLICCITLQNIAQPNQGFETWTPSFNYETPTGWQTLNVLHFISPSNPLSVSKAVGIDVHSGNYALKLQTIDIAVNPAPQTIDDTMGVMFTGLINLSPFYYKYGFPYTTRPEKLTFWYKYLPVGIDTGGAKVVLKKFQDSSSITVGKGSATFEQTLTYTQMTVNIDYFSDDIPDTCIVIFASSQNKICAQPGSTLFLDDVELSGWVGIDEPQKLVQKVKIFPNPAKEKISFLTELKNAQTLQITDLQGRVVGDYKIEPYGKLDLTIEFLTEGMYLYTIRDEKNKPINTGKFNISR
jgi:hypothetical protein